VTLDDLKTEEDPDEVPVRQSTEKDLEEKKEREEERIQ
jgi:hypothetical protein